MSQSVQAFAIGETSVRQSGGLFSLNDLHSAAGGEAKHKPSEWLRNQQTQELVTEISKAGIPTFETKRGNGAGTYACRELVIAYAAWISAAFHLKVIRVFLDAVSPSNAPQAAATLTPAQKQHLHELVDLVAATGKQTYGETWARLHRKFKVNSYHELPTDQFRAASDYLRSKMDDNDMSALVAKHFQQRRFMAYFNESGNMTMQAIAHDAAVLTYEQIPKHMASMSNPELSAINTASSQELAQRLRYLASKSIAARQ